MRLPTLYERFPPAWCTPVTVEVSRPNRHVGSEPIPRLRPKCVRRLMQKGVLYGACRFPLTPFNCPAHDCRVNFHGSNTTATTARLQLHPHRRFRIPPAAFGLGKYCPALPARSFPSRSIIIFSLLAGATASAQMTTGSAMEDFAKAFNLSAKGWSVQQIRCSRGANVLWPGDDVTFTFFIKPGQPYKGPLKADVIRYGTRGKPGDWWKPVVFKIAETGSSAQEVDLPAEGGSLEVSPKIGEAFGGYAIILDLGERGRAFGCTCVRVPTAEPGRERLPTYAMDLGWPHEMSPQVFNVFKRLGVKGARAEGGYNTIADAHIDWAMENDLTLMLTVGCGNTPREQQPLGRGRPWLKADNTLHRGRQRGSRLAALVRSGVQALPQGRGFKIWVAQRPGQCRRTLERALGRRLD